MCEVWYARTTLEEAPFADILSRSELGRAAAFADPADRARSLTGAWLLRVATGRRAGVPPASLHVHRDCPGCGSTEHGRPNVRGAGVHVSVSHSGALAGVSLCARGRTGLDVQRVGPLELARRLGPSLVTTGNTSTWTASDWWRVWVRKEAVVKATGDGLSVELDRVVVNGPRSAPVLQSYPGSVTVDLVDLTAPHGYVAAVASVDRACSSWSVTDLRGSAAVAPAR